MIGNPLLGPLFEGRAVARWGANNQLRLPKEGLLLYLGRPNLEAADVPIGDDTEIGDDTIIRWMFLLPADADIRAATGWVSGVGNIFYDAAGDPVAVLASDIADWADITITMCFFILFLRILKQEDSLSMLSTPTIQHSTKPGECYVRTSMIIGRR